MNNPSPWRLGALASAIALLGSLSSFDTQAMALGRITVLSALGEPLRAEIDIADINAEEAATLKAGPASSEAFKAAGIEYTNALIDLQVSLQRRADGRAYLRLSSARPVNEPFVDLILEAKWSSGRIVRDYTMLFDPPNLREARTASSSVTPIPPMISAAPPRAETAPSGPGFTAAPAARPAPVARAAAPTPPVARPAPAPVAKAALGASEQVTVKPGDTAGKIAVQKKPASVSLDQMLVAMLRGNPEAFIGGNINRLRSGAVLDIPSADSASQIAPSAATSTLIAQSKDFNDFRRKLAQSVPDAQVGAANRQATGQVQAKVDDKAAVNATPDKLTLSKGAVQSTAAAEEKIARDRQSKESSDRVAELAKNISDLNKIAGTPAVAGSAATAANAAASPTATSPSTAGNQAVPPGTGLSVPAAGPAVAIAAATPPVSPATTPASTGSLPAAASGTSTIAGVPPAATAPAAGTSAEITSAQTPALTGPALTSGSTDQAAPAATAPSAPAAVAKPVAQPAPVVAEPSLIDEITENPLLLPGGAALLLLLGGYAFYRYRHRDTGAQVDSSFLESRLQPDSFFGASGGQRVDTSEGGASGSSLVYSPSQLDAAGDVDPVAEADVYLAYGRDLQAEEILKEAIRTSPTRVAIHSKLMEIYAKRRDAKAFEVVAVEAFNLTRGEGSEWSYIADMGRELDPTNLMYQPGGKPASSGLKSTPFVADPSAAFGSSTLPQKLEPHLEPIAEPIDFDLDLDFSLDDEPASSTAAGAPISTPLASPALKPAPVTAKKQESEHIFDELDMDFGSTAVAVKPTAHAAKQATQSAFSNSATDTAADHGLDFDMELPIATKPAASRPAALMDSGMLEFDMDALSLELEGPADAAHPAVAAVEASPDGPLETKFSLAEEFRTLGDMDGARSLAEEVLAEAKGPLKSKAQSFLNALS